MAKPKKETLPPIVSFPDSRCRRCVLHATTSNVCVGYYGNTRSNIIVVGEAPGEAEERTGRPFQGKSGQLLTKLLDKVGINREEIYITNSVKCRPPDNRAPKNPELKACSEYLKHELSTIKPKYGLLLGATALKQVLGKTGITELHGSIFEKDGVQYLPTFHPAAALRDTKRLGPLELDIVKFGRLITDSIESKPKLNLRVITQWSDELLEEMRKCRIIVFDLETTSLDRFGPEDHVNYIGIGTLHTQWELKVPLWKGDIRPFLKAISEIMEQKEGIAHNGKFDNLWLEYHFGVKFNLTFDTIIAAHLNDENSALSLKYLAKVHCAGHDYDIGDKVKTHLGPETEEYLGYDLYYTRKLYHFLKTQLQRDEALWELFIHLSMPTARAYEIIESNGVFINTDRFSDVRKELTRERNKRLIKLKKQATINWNSPDQVADVFYTRLGLPITNMTPGGKPSTDEATLKSLAEKYPIAQDLLDFRETEKLMSTYVEGWQKRLKNDFWLFPGFKTTGTVTGRPSCVDPNIQQTPRNKLIRSLVDAPPGWEVFEADYSQIELRITAQSSQDPALLYAYTHGIDVHTLTASEVMGVPMNQVTEDQRKMAKAVNFGLIYGMKPPKFKRYCFEKYGIRITDRESVEFCDKFFAKYDLRKWHDRQIKLAHVAGQVRTLTGRVRHLPDIFSPDRMLRSQAERQSINSPVQGFAAELTLMSICEMVGAFPTTDLQLFGTVHDATLGRVRRRVKHKVLPRIKSIMEHPKIMDVLGITLDIPIEVDIKVGPWGRGKKYEIS